MVFVFQGRQTGVIDVFVCDNSLPDCWLWVFSCMIIPYQMCFKDAMFPLLARMRHGLYYNTYLVPDCRGSGLMQAFSKHLLARLNITQEPSSPDQLRVTLLSRSTKHRRIVNEEEVRGISSMFE